jgi:hypothetical protein
MPVHINPDDDGLLPMITCEDATHFVIMFGDPEDHAAPDAG